MNNEYAYEQFVEEFIGSLNQQMETASVDISRNETTRVNETRDSVSVRMDDSLMAPVIYLDDKYELYRSGYSIDEVAGLTAKTVKEAYSTMPPVPEFSRESARDNLYCAVVNTAANADLLRTVPHEQLEDLSVIARYKVDDVGSFVVTDAMCGRFKMTPEEVLEQAHINTNGMDFPCRDMYAVINDCMLGKGQGDGAEAQLYDNSYEPENRMYVMTNKSGIDGAAAITSKRAMDQAYLQLGQDFYILPSSRHEVILIPESSEVSAKELKAMVQEVNQTTVERSDRLSDNVYFYKGNTKTFCLADSPKLSKDKNIVNHHEKTTAEDIKGESYYEQRNS